MKSLNVWVYLIVAVVIGYALKQNNTELAIILLFAMVTGIWFELTKVGEASGKTTRDNFAKITKQIEEGEVVEPKHSPPASANGYGETVQMFYDFAGFADKVNHHLQWGGWRLQEEPTGDDSRNYEVLYNDLKVGKLSIGPWLLEYRTAETEVSLSFDLGYARLCFS